MPLRSVEAATRDDAIAAAREQFGPPARVVGVRRVRSGGVLGFFATERYVAEVAPDPAGPCRAVPVRGRRRRRPRDDAPADFSSPLASAAPARARRPPRRATVPRPGPPRPRARRSRPARHGRRRPLARPAPRPRPVRRPGTRPTAGPTTAARTTTRVSELAGLLAAQQAEPARAAPAYARAAFPRRPPWRTSPPATTLLDDDDASEASVPADAVGAPSPFTAALARMVAGDRDVRQAVEEASWPAARRRVRAHDAEPLADRSGPVAQQTHRCRRLRRARRRKRWEIRSSRRPPRPRPSRWRCPPGPPSPRCQRCGLLARGGDRRGPALRPGPGALRRGPRRHPAQGPGRGLAADAR